MHSAALLVLLFAALYPATAQEQPRLQNDDNPETVAEIKTLEVRLSALIVAGKWDEFAKSIASGYVRTIGEAKPENREQALATLRSGEPKVVAMIPEEMEVRLYGDAAILTAHLTLTARQDNRVRERHAWMTEVFIRRTSSWFLAATQITFIGK
jgi:uncharacterized protein DUF4440